MTQDIRRSWRSRVMAGASVCAVLALGMAEPAAGQTNFGGTSGTSAIGGSRVTGSTGSIGSVGSVGSARSVGSAGSFGSRALGQGVTAGQRTMGRGTAGGSAMGVAGSANVGQIDSSERFLRQNRQAGSFVGADSRDNTAYLLGAQGNAAGARAGAVGARGNMQNFNTRTSQNFNRGANVNRGGMGGANLFGALGGLGALGGAGAARGRTREVRTALSVAFDHPAIDAEKVSEQISRRINGSESVAVTGIQRIRALTPVQAARDSDGSLVLTGTVATERDRALAERLALLEPGVWKVRNEITVSADADQPAVPPTPPLAPGPPALGVAAPK